MTRVRIATTFPTLKAKHAEHSAIGEASTTHAAIARALREVFKHEGVKGKNVKRGMITFCILPNLSNELLES